jgi:acyl carrier protein
VTVPGTDPLGTELWREVAVALREATGADAGFLAGLRPDTRLDGDLLVDSVELAALGELLRQRFGGTVDLPGLVAGLDLDEIIALTLADVADHVTAHRAPAAHQAPIDEPAGHR